MPRQFNVLNVFRISSASPCNFYMSNGTVYFTHQNSNFTLKIILVFFSPPTGKIPHTCSTHKRTLKWLKTKKVHNISQSQTETVQLIQNILWIIFHGPIIPTIRRFHTFHDKSPKFKRQWPSPSTFLDQLKPFQRQNIQHIQNISEWLNSHISSISPTITPSFLAIDW